MNLINKTNLSFVAGQKLTAADINTINNTINACVDAVNLFLSGLCNINTEFNNTTTYTLSTAVNSAPRRAIGMKLRFKSADGFVEYNYNGSTINDTDWKNTNNWSLNIPESLDGGVWE